MGCLLSILRHSKSSLKRYFPRRYSIVACSSSTSVTLPPPIYFEGPAHCQDFSLPDPIIDYIAKNASSAIVYRKLVQSCKYFFIKRPLIVISCFHYTKDGFSTCLIDKDGNEKFDMEKIPAKLLWLAVKCGKKCNRYDGSYGPSTSLTPKLLIPKFYRVESSRILLNNATSTLEEIVFLASPKATQIHLRNCFVQYENGESVQLETLIAQFPLLQRLFYTCHPDGSNISTKTVKKILANPNLSKMKSFHLYEIPDTFEVEGLFEYLKSRDDLYCCLVFREDISADYQDRLEVIIDELLSTESTSYRFGGV